MADDNVENVKGKRDSDGGSFKYYVLPVRARRKHAGPRARSAAAWPRGHP